jgi:hypothetical protein
MGWTACQQIFDLIMAVLKGKSLHVDVCESRIPCKTARLIAGMCEDRATFANCDMRRHRAPGVFPLCGRPCVCHRHCRMPSAGPETSRL